MSYGPPCPFRAVGFSGSAGNYPLSTAGKAIIAEHNGVSIDALPFGSRFSSGAHMHRWIEALGERYMATGEYPRRDGRWLSMRELEL
ncbi:MAG: hypothetical protein ABW043_16990 [Devosia sp.]|uniref:hypothetical protein n=1 Tax=Devosia sp. TaxID=1871048 RepID=UPI0033996C23